MKTTLVLGASLKSERYSNIAMHRLVKFGHPVKAFGLQKGEVAGVSIDTVLKNYEDIDTITLYLNPKRQTAYYNYIMELKPNRVIFNPGTENPDFFRLLSENNIDYEVACTLVLLSTGQY